MAFDSKEKKGIGSNFLDLLVIFLKWKRFLIVFTLIGMLISIIFYFFVFDLIYYSTSTLKSSQKISLLSGVSGIPDLEGLDEFGIGGGRASKELASYQEILSSRRCLESLIKHFNLMERDEYTIFEDYLKNFREEKLVLNINRVSGYLEVGVYDKDPVLATKMVEYLLEQLDLINTELNIQNAKSNREFIENRYMQSKNDLARSEDSLKSFQLIYGVAPDLQIKASAQTVFMLEGELKSEEVKLDVIKKILASDQSEVKVQEAKVNSLRNKVADIQNSTDLGDFLRLGNSPQIALEFLRLQREVEIQTRILTFLLPIYEQSKIEEKRDTPTIIVLDKPYVPEKKSKPKRLTMTIVVTIICFCFSFFIAYMIEESEKIRINNPIAYDKVRSMLKKNKTVV